MVQRHSTQSRKRLLLFIVSGLAFLVAMLLWFLVRNNPQKIIRSTLKAAGFSDREINNWIAISAHETAGWTSRVYREGKNLFGMKLPTGETTAIGKLPYGEGQAIFSSVQSSADDLVLFLTKRWRYPKDFATLEDQINYMKARNYFGDTKANYYAAVLKWKNDLDLTGKNQEV